MNGDDMPIWATSAYDQLAGAMQAGDPEAYGAIGLDAVLRACEYDSEHSFGGQPVPFDRILAMLMSTDRGSALLVSTEAVRRLLEQRRNT